MKLKKKMKKEMKFKVWNINPILKVLLLGTHSPQSPLRKLRGVTNTILKYIYQLVVLFWKQNIEFNPNAHIYEGSVWFPRPNGININMMPFDRTQKNSLPAKYHQYWPMIESCKGLESKICYLTIQESLVEAGKAQRRTGLHTESPGYLHEPGQTSTYSYLVLWGGGREEIGVTPSGGIFMASNIGDSCRIYPCQIRKHGDMVGEGGEMSFLREFLPPNKFKSILVGACHLIWLTYTTPHEALPVKKKCYRQFLRVVGKVSVWYSQHSTPNPFGIKDESVKILDYNKFET